MSVRSREEGRAGRTEKETVPEEAAGAAVPLIASALNASLKLGSRLVSKCDFNEGRRDGGLTGSCHPSLQH